MKLGVVFPGQGSQSPGMLADIATEFPEIFPIYENASNILGYDLWELTQNNAEQLNQTIYTQPALLTASYAIWKIITSRKKIQPEIVAGHSLGEYTALVCANAFSFSDALTLVAARGKYMQEAVPEGQGALAAIVGLDNDVVTHICEQAAEKDIISPANFNSPGQIVLAGHSAAVERAIALANEAGARMAKLLSVSVPSHCILMKPASLKLTELLNGLSIQTPTIPVINNTDVSFYQDADSIRKGLARQLFMPVRWLETIQAFAKQGINQIIECGPGKVLSGLNRRISADIPNKNTSDLTNLKMLLDETLN